MSFEPTSPQPDDRRVGDGPTDTFEAAPADPTDSTTTTGTMAPPRPPGPAGPGGQRRLVRDPYTRLGGVASGLAHHYGVDVSIVRLLFILSAFASGFGLLVYLLAWLVIPRATYWPPVPPARPLRSLSGRELGVGLALLGLLVALALGAEGAAAVVIPLVLVAGGVWLLLQPSADEDEGAPAQPVAAAGGGGGTGTPIPPAGYSAGPPPAPVPPRSRRRVFGIIGAVILAILAIPLLLLTMLFVAVATGNLDLDIDGETREYRPATVAAIPTEIEEGAADVLIDLTDLDSADFDGRSTPVEVEARVDVGRITVLVPDDVDVSVDANVDVGDLTVFGRTADGFGNEIARPVDDPDVELDLEVDLGDIQVRRG